MVVTHFRWSAVALMAWSMLVTPPQSGLRAQETQPVATDATTSAPTAPDDEAAPLEVADELAPVPAFSTEELEQIVAPIALYPDVLLIQVLLAATYPLDVVRAHRFVQRNPDVTPEELVNRAEAQGWDPSVISLVAFPTVLERMAMDLDWTEQLGNAMALQSEDLLDAVQSLRALAQASGALESNEYQAVAFAEEDTISIAPAQPEVIYVPQYEPQQVFITQPAATTYVTPPATTTVVVKETGYSESTLVTTGLVAFTTGILIGNYFGGKDKYHYYWGPPHSHVVWHHHRIYPPYYRPGGYRPPYYRPPPPGYRPGDAWRPRPELYRDANVAIDHRRQVSRDVNRNVSIDVGGRTSTLERQLRDRGRDPAGATRPVTPLRPAEREGARPHTAERATPVARPDRKDTAFGNQQRQPEVRKNRDRGAASADRASRPETAQPQRRIQPQTSQQPAAQPQRRNLPQVNQQPTAPRGQTPLLPQPGQRPQAGQRPTTGGAAFEMRDGNQTLQFRQRGQSSAGGGQRKR